MFGYPYQQAASYPQWGSGFGGFPGYSQPQQQFGGFPGYAPQQQFGQQFGAPAFNQFNQFQPFQQQAAPQKKFKLIYFDAKGRGEAIRLAFHIGGIDFEDYRVPRDEFKNNLKSKVPFGQVPVLEIDGGVQLAQSMAILRFVGRIANLYPSDPFSAARIDEVLYLIDDAAPPIRRALQEQDETRKAEGLKKLIDETLPRFLGYFEGLLSKAGSGFVSTQFSIADLALYVFINQLSSGHHKELHEKFPELKTTLLDKTPLLKDHQHRIAEHPKVKEWDAAHPAKA